LAVTILSTSQLASATAIIFANPATTSGPTAFINLMGTTSIPPNGAGLIPIKPGVVLNMFDGIPTQGPITAFGTGTSTPLTIQYVSGGTQHF